MARKRNVWFVAAENGALPGGKVGGVADVVRDLPAALAAEAWAPTVVTPAYGILHQLPGAKRLASISVCFGGSREDVAVWQVPGSFDAVENLVFDHAIFADQGAGVIYTGGEPARPYAADATRFAFFCAAVAAWLQESDALPEIIHLHDWHAAFFCLLQNYADEHRRLRNIRTVFTIHNIAYQGTRPLREDDSSLEHWFPGLDYDVEAVQDPAFTNCLNPMAAAIRLADKLSTVSPTYAREICRPSDAATGFVGGEGLEKPLQTAADAGRLTGILNGCYYDQPLAPAPRWTDFLAKMRRQVSLWRSREPSNEAHRIAERRLERLSNGSVLPEKPRQLLVSVGRLVAQKATLFVAPAAGGLPALQQIAEDLADDGLLIVLGSGEALYENTLLAIARQCDNIIFLQGYSEDLADSLYRLGNLFLMPSSFEPCGISQLLAMREGQPCVVNGVGGLKDTVRDGDTGFVFSGDKLTRQASAFVDTTKRALEIHDTDGPRWQTLCDNAARQRFDWSSSAKATSRLLYEAHRG